MKKGFLAKKPMANAGQKALKVAEVGVGTTGAAYLSNKVIGAKINPKYHGLIMLALGIGGNMFVEDPHVNNIATGIGAYGVLRSTADYVLPKQKADLGLSGFGATAEVNWDELAAKAKAKADAEARINGPEDLNGHPTDMKPAADLHEMRNMVV